MEWKSIEQPPNLDKITCVNISNNNLTKIPDWICKCNNLRKLNCSGNQITQIPFILPNFLRIFYCYNNKITQIPNTLPNSLQLFDCSFNKITQFPNTLPDFLQKFDCSNNKITQIPDILPNFLEYFYCYNNKIIEIPLLIIQLQKIIYFACGSTYSEIYTPPLVEYFLDNLDNKENKRYCYDIIWKVRMEF